MAETLACCVAAPTIQQRASTPTIHHERITNMQLRQPTLPATTSPSPKPVRAPWKGLWRGPLPPRRVTPAAKLGDFIRDPKSKDFQISNPRTGASAPDPTPPNRPNRTMNATREATHRDTLTRDVAIYPIAKPALGGPKRQLIDISAFHVVAPQALHVAAPVLSLHAAAPVLSYRDALMAGNRGYSRGRAIAGHGTLDRRGKGRGPPLDAHGRDRGGQGHGRRARGSHSVQADPGHGDLPLPGAAANEGRGRGAPPPLADTDSVCGRGRGDSWSIANNNRAASLDAAENAPGCNGARGGAQGVGQRPQGSGRGRGANAGNNFDSS